MSVTLPRKLSEQAAELVVALTADTPQERAAARNALDVWKAADPRHAQAAERMEYLLGQLEDVQRIGAGATAKLSRSDFGLTWNSALETGGVLVGDEVKITIDIEAVRS